MKLKKILALLTILLLTLTACKSTEEPVDDEKPLKLSERAGVYTGSIPVNNGNTTFYSIVEVKASGDILVNSVADNPNPDVSGGTSKAFSDSSQETIFQLDKNSLRYDIVFISKTQLTLKMTSGFATSEPSITDLGTLVK